MGRGLSPESKGLMRRIRAVFEEENPLGPRRCSYALFGNRGGAMAPKVGQLCGRLLDAGQLPLDWYDDSSRSEVSPNVVEDVDDFVALKKGAPYFDAWQSQPFRVKVWSEKSVGGTLAPVLDSLLVPFLNTIGWNSRKILMEEAVLTRKDPRRLVILYCCDHDAAGLRMSDDDLPKRLTKYGAVNWEIRRVTITRDDFNALSKRGLVDPVKASDPNAHWYYERSGLRHGVELEALPAPELRKRVEAAIRDCIVDADAWSRSIDTSVAVRKSWESYVSRWPRPTISIEGLDPGYEGQP